MRFRVLLALLAALPSSVAYSQQPVRATLAQFRSLSWLSGSWRGLDTGGKPFFEEYRVINDSTIGMRQFSDSTFKTATPDSSLITLRGGVVSSRGSSGTPSLAMELTATKVRFVRTGATRGYAFTKDSADQWTARIEQPNRPDVVYVMKRVARRP